jgi:hypothetical protein
MSDSEPGSPGGENSARCALAMPEDPLEIGPDEQAFDRSAPRGAVVDLGDDSSPNRFCFESMFVAK